MTKEFTVYGTIRELRHYRQDSLYSLFSYDRCNVRKASDLAMSAELYYCCRGPYHLWEDFVIYKLLR
jgi:hypothetical protein